MRGGQVVGQTDFKAAFPVSQAWSPADVCTTVFDALGDLIKTGPTGTNVMDVSVLLAC